MKRYVVMSTAKPLENFTLEEHSEGNVCKWEDVHQLIMLLLAITTNAQRQWIEASEIMLDSLGPIEGEREKQ